jgi:aryl-alcohol dehydrogenase-like predicted oxidoreductase
MATAAQTLRNPTVEGAIAGFSGLSQVDPLSGAAALRLSDDEVAGIEGRD